MVGVWCWGLQLGWFETSGSGLRVGWLQLGRLQLMCACTGFGKYPDILDQVSLNLEDEIILRR